MDIICQKCNSVNDYQILQSGPHTTAYCNQCGSYIKHLPSDKPITIYFGKYKGTHLKDFTTKEQCDWLRWAVQNATNIKPALIEAIKKHLGI